MFIVLLRAPKNSLDSMTVWNLTSFYHYVVSGSAWIVTCSQMTQPEPIKVGDSMVCLPVFGFVMTKMRPSVSLPQLRLKTLHEKQSNKPISENLEASVLAWIKGLQNGPQLRYKREWVSYCFFLSFVFIVIRLRFCVVLRSFSAMQGKNCSAPILANLEDGFL